MLNGATGPPVPANAIPGTRYWQYLTKLYDYNGPSPICLCASQQVTAQKNQWELDKLQTQSEMLKKFAVDEVDSHSKEGAYVVGLSMQGARWDPNAVSIEKSKARIAPCMLRRTRSFSQC